MSLFAPRYYVYVIFSIRGLYVGKGTGCRVRESLKERHGLFSVIVGRYFTQKGAYGAETRLIRAFRCVLVPLQNGRAPRSSIWRRFLPRRRQRVRLNKVEVLVGLIFWAFVICMICG